MTDERSDRPDGGDELRFRDPIEMAREGITAARVGDFESGYRLLGEACDRIRKSGAKVPAPAISFYGLCIAAHTGRFKEAAEFCQAAIDAEPFKAEYYANLVAVCLAGRSRRKAVAALQRGLALEPENQRLLGLEAKLGSRRTPVLAFLSRANALNVGLGRLRHVLSSSRKNKAGGKTSGRRD